MSIKKTSREQSHIDYKLNVTIDTFGIDQQEDVNNFDI